VSAPPLIAWRYNVVPEPGSAEDKLVQVLRHPRDWVVEAPAPPSVAAS
jgi:coproporphyrinogen III oxidase